MDIAKKIMELREETGENRKEFSAHTGIPVRTLEDWEAGRRTPPEYIPRLIEYQIRYEKLLKSKKDYKQMEILSLVSMDSLKRLPGGDPE